MKIRILLMTLVLFSLPFLNAEETPQKRSWTEYFFHKSKAKKSDAAEETNPKKSEKVEETKPKKSSSKSFNEEEENLNPEGMTDLIDVPTSNIIDYGGYRLNFRLYSQGGLLTHLSFGVFRRLNIGASWDNEKVIGTDDPRTNTPTLNVKFRVYDGGAVLPSFAIGYDGQGRFFDRTADEYSEKEKGLYAVLGRELFLPGLEFHGGTNISRFKDGAVYGFLGVSYLIEQKLALMTEYDNVRNGPDNRWNAGVRLFPIPSLSIDFAFRRIASVQDKERIVRINYVGSF